MSNTRIPQKVTQVKLSKKAKASVNRMIKKFQDGDLSALVQISTFELPDDAPAKKWTFSNKVLAFAQTGSLDCRGYKQWGTAGRQVKKGSVAGYIFSPRMKKVTNKEGEEERRLIGFNQIPVFGANDTEGDEPLADYTPKELPPLTDIAKEFNISVEYMPMIDRKGDCTIDGKSIRLGTDHPRTWFHELAHALHAKIDGGLSGSSKNTKTHANAEAVAEFTACILMDIYGFGDYSGYAWNYIGSYHPDPLKAIMKACSKVEEILILIEDTLP
jgi:hypothetical protein